MANKRKPLGIETIKAINKEYEETEHIKTLLKELLYYARVHSYYNIDEYTEAKRVMLNYIAHLRKHRKDLLKGLYIEEL